MVDQEKLRALPAIHELLEHTLLQEAIKAFGRDAVVVSCRSVIDNTRAHILEGGTAIDETQLAQQALEFLKSRPQLYTRVINATGVILHTNLGRSPLPKPAWEAMEQAAHYCDLEMDLENGKRASRLRGISTPIAQLTGAESGLIVNNNAAAVLLAIAGLAGTKPTAISRGHLVEIGGSFRLPTIMEASGSPMLEVGSTNRTHLQDFEQVLQKGIGLVLLVHKSNFTMSGFVTEPRDEEVIQLAHQYNTPVILDLGSGNFTDTKQFNLPDETTVSKAVARGFDAVCFSGDKLLGGPQAGLIAGTKEVCEKLNKHPLARALRCDKMQLAGVLATIQLYLRHESLQQIPIWTMIKTPKSALKLRAELWQKEIGTGDVVQANGAIGGGSLPDAKISGYALSLSVKKPEKLLYLLRQSSNSLVGHISNDHVLLHPRTVHPDDDAAVSQTLKEALDKLNTK